MNVVAYCKGKNNISLDDISNLLLHCAAQENSLRERLLDI